MQSWIITIATIVIGACAILAAMGFRGRVSTIGVDLGTTFSVVGVSMNGKVEIIEDSNGHQIFPSIVSYLDNGDVVTGYDALKRLTSHPEMTIFNAKRFIGRDWEDPSVQDYAAALPFRLVRAANVSNFTSIAFDVPLQDTPLLVSPETIGTHILKYLLSITSTYLGHKQVNKAVIAVPAKFDSRQRMATAEAYKQAGLKVVRVIEEPTAAAVAYKLHKNQNIQHILVYDFGGGTLDISILYVAKGSVQVYATDGDEYLGGSDFDTCLVDYITAKMSDQFTQEMIMEPELVVAHECTLAGIRQKAEEIKKQLTYVDEVTFICFEDKYRDDLARVVANKIEFTISKAQFEDACADLFAKSLTPVHRLLGDLGMSISDIDEVVLVGGTTRIPLVKQQLRDLFQKELNDKIDPDVTVAYGAASILD